MLITKKYVTRYFHLCVLCMLCLISACTPLSTRETVLKMPLVPVESLGKNWQVTQSIAMVKEDKTSSPEFIAAWSTQKNHLSVVGLTPAGQVLMHLDYTGSTFTEGYSTLLKNKPSRQRNISANSMGPLAYSGDQKKYLHIHHGVY